MTISVEDKERLLGMWRECADDLRRWARAFNDTSTDSATGEALNELAFTLEHKAAPGPMTVRDLFQLFQRLKASGVFDPATITIRTDSAADGKPIQP